ncbi:MAG: four helix bundle protein [Patescibacteria group bacterium]|jgi:four helix bundle protein
MFTRDKTFRFRNFKVYKDSKIFYRNINNITKIFPKDCLYELTSQLKRSALSIVLNIAEGSAKESDKDFKRYLGNSLGSINEVVACLDIAFESKYVSNEVYLKLVDQAQGIAKQLGGFYKKLKNS